MKCAGCDVMFRGIADLMPRKLEGKARGMQTHEMLCKDCMKTANEAKGEYAKASRGQ